MTRRASTLYVSGARGKEHTMLIIAQIQEIRNNLSRLLGKVKVTDGTHDMPAMDAAARPGFMKLTDGENTAPAMDAAARPGWQHTLEMPLAQRVDWDAAGTTCYIGWAAPGAAGGAGSWRIKKVSLSGNDVTTLWADGDYDYDNVWDNRTSLTYS